MSAPSVTVSHCAQFVRVVIGEQVLARKLRERPGERAWTYAAQLVQLIEEAAETVDAEAFVAWLHDSGFATNLV